MNFLKITQKVGIILFVLAIGLILSLIKVSSLLLTFDPNFQKELTVKGRSHDQMPGIHG